MRAVVYRFRGELRTRWVARLVLAVLIGAVAATVLVFAAGARRSGSAHDRFRAANNGFDVGVATQCRPMKRSPQPPSELPPQDSCHDELARLPAVDAAATVGVVAAYIETLDGRSLQPDPSDPCYSDAGNVTVLSAGGKNFGRTL